MPTTVLFMLQIAFSPQRCEGRSGRPCDDLSILGVFVFSSRHYQRFPRGDTFDQVLDVKALRKTWDDFRHFNARTVPHFVGVSAGSAARTGKANAHI